MGGSERFSSKKAKVSQFNQLPSLLITYVNIMLKRLNVQTVQFSSNIFKQALIYEQYTD